MGALKRVASSEPEDTPGERRYTSSPPTGPLRGARLGPPAATLNQATSRESPGSSTHPSDEVAKATWEGDGGAVVEAAAQGESSFLNCEAGPVGELSEKTGGEARAAGLPAMLPRDEEGLDCREADGESGPMGGGNGGAALNGSGGAIGAGDGPSDGDVAPVAPTEGLVAQPLPPDLARWVEELSGDIRHILEHISAAGGHTWLVGGCVRDVVSAKIPREVDVTTTLLPERVMEVFDGEVGMIAVPHKTTGGAFGTVSVQRGSAILEVTTLRTDGTYTDGRRPDEVTYTTSLLEDLRRRDFTMNAVALDAGTLSGRPPALYDPFGGVRDAQEGVLRTVGDPSQRLTDDGLRVWRAYRFMDAGPWGLRTLDADLDSALKSDAVQKAASRASRERIWEEMTKLLVGANAGGVLAVMAEHGALKTALPGLPPAALTGSARGVRAQHHLLHAWQRWLEHAPLRGMDQHSGTAVGGRQFSGTSGAENGNREAMVGSSMEPVASRWVLVLDLEATCDLPKIAQPQEVIEMAALLLDGKTLQELSSFHSLCRPTLRPRLSDFCISLTGLTQAEVDGAAPLGNVLASLAAWLQEQGVSEAALTRGNKCAGTDILTVTVGDEELEVLLPKQAQALGLTVPPYLQAWCNVQLMYREHYLRPRCGMLLMLSELGLPLIGRQHSARDDVANLAALLRTLAGSGCAPELTGSTDGRAAAYLGDTPDLALARLALLLEGQPEKIVMSCLKSMRIGRHEAARVTKAVKALGCLPGGGDLGALRLFRHIFGSQLKLQLLLEASLAYTEKILRDLRKVLRAQGPEEVGRKLEELLDVWGSLPALGAGAAPLLDGARLMAATGLGPGQRLGRLKEWLWRVQIERDLIRVEEVEGLLSELPWREQEPSTWPRLVWH